MATIKLTEDTICIKQKDYILFIDKNNIEIHTEDKTYYPTSVSIGENSEIRFLYGLGCIEIQAAYIHIEGPEYIHTQLGTLIRRADLLFYKKDH